VAQVQEAVELLLVAQALAHREGIEEALGGGEEQRHLLLHGQGLVLVLLQDLGQALALGQHGRGGLVEVAGEHGEGGQLAELGQVDAQAAGHRLHGLHLRAAAHARHRVAHVHGRADAGVEEVALQEDLAVGDGDDVGGDVGRDVAGLGLDDGDGGERAAALAVAQLGRPLQEPAVQVEDVARVGLASGRPPQQERDLAVGGGVLGEVVVDAERVLSVVAEVLAHGAARVGGQVEEGGGVGGGGGDDDGVLEGALVLQRLHHLGHRALLLADGHVDADDALALLVDDGVDGDGRLARLAVADQQLALAAADVDHGVDGLDAGLQRLAHRLPLHHARGDALDGPVLLGGDGALAVDGLTERAHHPAHQLGADGDGHDAAGALDLVALLDLGGLAHEHRAHRVLLEVQGDAGHAVGQLQELAGHAALQAEDAGDAVAHGEDGAHLGHVHPGGEAAQLLLQDLADLVGADLHRRSRPPCQSAAPSRSRSARSRPRTVPS
jgi:hypothetical protein